MFDLCFKEASKSIEAYARNRKLVGHESYPNGDSDYLKNILIKLLIYKLRDNKSSKRVLLYSLKTLTE